MNTDEKKEELREFMGVFEWAVTVRGLPIEAVLATYAYFRGRGLGDPDARELTASVRDETTRYAVQRITDMFINRMNRAGEKT